MMNDPQNRKLPDSGSEPDSGEFLPTCSIENLQRRSEFLRKIRGFFEAREFVEVETPLLSTDVVVDRHIEPIAVHDLKTQKSTAGPFWLQTSPEFAMKRLLAAGAKRIFQICKAFRNAERGQQHNPEFTMLEWYRVGDDYEQGRLLLADFAKHVFSVDRVEQVCYQQAFTDVLGLCPFTSPMESLIQFANDNANVQFGVSESRDEVLNVLLSHCVEPTLGSQVPTILFDFPASQSALARVRMDEVPVAERFELYFRGVELANGYHELCDAEELLTRNQKVNQQRMEDGKEPLPAHSRLMLAMKAGLPSCSGVAVGVDRLMMLLMNEKGIEEVIPFPIERA